DKRTASASIISSRSSRRLRRLPLAPPPDQPRLDPRTFWSGPLCKGVLDPLSPISPSPWFWPLGDAPAEPEPPVFLRLKRLRNARFSELFIRNAAVCNAVAAAALLARCARAACSFDAHSGRIRSVRTTFGSLADTDWLRRR